MSANIPNDPVILLSYVNTQLRDQYASLDELCASLDLDETVLCRKLDSIGYVYSKTQNQFQ